MTQSRRGPVRAELSDLQNIVDRLDLLMGTSDAQATQPGTSNHAGSARSQLDQTLMDLTNRLEELEADVEELRTLVNHLMTIAMWQAKVTASLVQEEAEIDEREPEDDEPDQEFSDLPGGSRYVPRAGPGPHERGTGEGERLVRRLPQTAPLDEDIDELLNDEVEPRDEGRPPPPDFGI